MLIRIADLIARRARWPILACVLLIGIASAMGEWMTSLDNRLETARIQHFPKTASGETVVVQIDTRSLSEIQTWPWPRGLHGQLLDRLNAEGVKQVAFDVHFVDPAADPIQDEVFAAAIERMSGRVILPALLEGVRDPNVERIEMLPIPVLRAHAQVAAIWIWLEKDLTARQIPYSMEMKNARWPTLATLLAEKPSYSEAFYPLDWSIDPKTIPTVSYADVLKGRYPAGFFRNKNVLVGGTSISLGDRFSVPVHGRIPGLYIQAIGAETLRIATPRPVGDWPALVVAWLVIAAALVSKRIAVRLGLLAAGSLAMLAVALVAREQAAIVATVGSASLALFTATILIAGAAITKAVVDRITLAPVSQLPNLTAMCLLDGEARTTVVVRLRNHAEITALLGREGQGELLRRVYSRLSLAASGATLFQVDDHSFGWRSDRSTEELADAIEGLHALFTSGLPLGERAVDVTITVGLCDDPALSTEAAVAAATVAADRAVQRGLAWERYVADGGADADWRLSLLGELDRAIDQGDVWIAYQPKYDLHSRRITGAEALVRWSHPSRGDIRPEQFIPLVEQSGRIDKLTFHVLRSALADFAALEDDSLSVAVNISMRMIGRNHLVEPVRDLLREYRFAPHRLTLEITESAAMTGPAGIEELRRLRALGVNISIDDYGTGQSTLSYLKTLPATELKIDRSFVQLILTSRSDATVVDSTVKLAHALGLKVVAEGVENDEVLEMLKKMNCDIVQGYHIGKPASFSAFLRTVASKRSARAA